jgi:hypothetical protein
MTSESVDQLDVDAAGDLGEAVCDGGELVEEQHTERPGEVRGWRL